jgi:hypothetical protein
MKRMRRLGAEGEEATFIVDMQFKRINPLLQMRVSMPPASSPLLLNLVSVPLRFDLLLRSTLAVLLSPFHRPCRSAGPLSGLPHEAFFSGLSFPNTANSSEHAVD